MSAAPGATFRSAVVLGAGAVGSFLGARLSRAVPTALVARGEHAEALRARPLRLSGLADEAVRVAVSTGLADPGERALVVVAVKLTGLVEAARLLAAVVRDDTTVLCIQNGLDPEAVVREELASCTRARPRVLRALVSAGCDLVRAGEVEYWGGGVTLPDSEETRPIAELFSRAGVPVELSRDFSADVWTKFALNCVANPLGAILGARNRELVTEELAPLRRAIVEEVRLCARDAGLELPAELAERIDSALRRSQNRNSMLQDILRGRPTEIDWLNGRVAELARSRGRDAPANRTLAELVRFAERRAGCALERLTRA